MTNREQSNHDDRLAAYLDGSMNESDCRVFEDLLQSDQKLAAEVDLQKRIDASLQRQFAPLLPSDEHVQAVAAAAIEPATQLKATVRRSRWPWIAGLATAASLAGILTLLNLDDGQPEPYFEPVPLARLYHEAVSHGFEPYYECRDDERFAAVFARRQGVPLHLEPMPPESRMLGLSYPGGLSRQTTAMLCQVDGKPVMVFVDRQEADLETASRQDDGSPAVNVFRFLKNGLVFYEVTPFSEARAVQYLVAADPPADALH